MSGLWSGLGEMLAGDFHIQPEGSLGTANAVNTASFTAFDSMEAKHCNTRWTERKGIQVE